MSYFPVEKHCNTCDHNDKEDHTPCKTCGLESKNWIQKRNTKTEKVVELPKS